MCKEVRGRICRLGISQTRPFTFSHQYWVCRTTLLTYHLKGKKERGEEKERRDASVVHEEKGQGKKVGVEWATNTIVNNNHPCQELV
jgi:hypothetical protein